jgi:hypothetical protein
VRHTARSATWTARRSRRKASRLVPCAARTPAPGIAPRATGSGPKSSRPWRMARDHSHVVVELDLGLKTVFTLRHGETVPDSVVKHALLGSEQR